MRGGVGAIMRNKDEVEVASLDSRRLPRPLQYPLPAHVARNALAGSPLPAPVVSEPAERLSLLCRLLSFQEERAWCRGKGQTLDQLDLCLKPGAVTALSPVTSLRKEDSNI